jgi:hypothetical protein
MDRKDVRANFGFIAILMLTISSPAIGDDIYAPNGAKPSALNIQKPAIKSGKRAAAKSRGLPTNASNWPIPNK